MERVLNELNGVHSVDVNLADKKVMVEYDNTEVSIEDLKNEIEDIGYDVE